MKPGVSTIWPCLLLLQAVAFPTLLLPMSFLGDRVSPITGSQQHHEILLTVGHVSFLHGCWGFEQFIMLEP